MKIGLKHINISLIEFLFLVCLVLNSGTLLKQDYSIASYGMVFFFILYLIKYLLKRRVAKKIIIYTLALLGILCLWLIQFNVYGAKNESFMTLLQNFILIFSTIIFCTIEPNKNRYRIKYFVSIELFFSVLSTIIFLSVILKINLSPQLAENGVTHTIFYVENFVLDSHFLFSMKNCGIFWEHGMYQIYLNFMLIYYLYISEEIKHKKFILVYLVTIIITTGSTTGIVLCPIIIVYYLFINNEITIKQLFLTSAVVIGLCFSASFIHSNIQDKLTRGLSYGYRMSDISLGIKVFLEKPLLGHGILNTAYDDSFFRVNSTIRGNSNGFFNILINFGLVGMCVYLVLLKRLLIYIKSLTGKKSLGIFVIWMIASICTEPITLHPFVIFLLGIGLNYKISEKEE